MRDLTNDPMVYKPLLPQLIPPLFDQIELVGLHIVEHLPQAARPLDLDGLGVRRLAQAEMQTEIALRNVASTAAHLLQLLVTTGTHGDPRANRGAIGLRASELQRDPASVFAVVLQQTGCVMAIVHKNFYRSIIVKVRSGHAVAVEGRGDAWTSIKGDIFELPVALVPVKYFALPEGGVEAVRIYLGIDVAIGHEQVRPAVVINVDKQCAPTQKLCVNTHCRDIGNVGESSVPVVVVERGSLVRKVRPDDVEPAVTVIIYGVGAHTGLFAPIFAVGDTRFDGNFREAPLICH